MVGQAGLYVSLGIVLAAHVVSVATGLSVSSIATDKKVGAGGPYYIISRSFGLPIGGAIELALFLGLSFSVSLYIVGFSQSFLSSFGYVADANTIRIAGSLTLVGITVITFISTSFAIRAQYVILVLVGGSLAVVFLGHPTASVPHVTASSESPSFGVLFGIFSRRSCASSACCSTRCRCARPPGVRHPDAPARRRDALRDLRVARDQLGHRVR
jgi:amino acid transporter